MYSQVRVDNLQNAVILEYRSSRTGEVVLQYPTQSQIDAFHEAERAHEKAKSSPATPQVSAPQEHQSSAPAPTQHVSAPAPSTPAPAPTTSGGGTGSTTSVVV